MMMTFPPDNQPDDRLEPYRPGLVTILLTLLVILALLATLLWPLWQTRRPRRLPPTPTPLFLQEALAGHYSRINA